MKIGITDRGYPQFERAVSRFQRKMIREIKRVVADSAEMMATQMKALAPVSDVDGGNLKKSIDVEYRNNGLTAVITVGAHYGVYIEFGTGIYAEGGDGRKTPWVYYDEKIGQWVFTRGMEAQPFFRPSVEKGMNHFKREMNKLGV